MERRIPLKIIARKDEEAPVEKPLALGTPPPRIVPILSQSSDWFGVSPAGWIAAAIFYGVIAAVALLTDWSVKPPEAWPQKEAVFKVVFAEPSPPTAPAEPQPSVAPALPPAPVASEPPPPEPEPAVPPPEQEALPATPSARELAEPPPAQATVEIPPIPRRKPRPPPASAQAPRFAERPAETPPAPPSNQIATTAAPQVAAVPIVPPRPISGLASNRKPDYPVDARQRGLQGRVILRVEVSIAGAPLNVSVVSSSGHKVLDQAALTAVEQWRFNPATRAGVPVAGAVDVPIQFRLED